MTVNGIYEEIAASCPSSTSAVTLYTYRGTQEIRDVFLMITNRGTVNAAATVDFLRGGGTPGNEDRALNAFVLRPNSAPFILPLPHMRRDDAVQVTSSVASALTFKLVGVRRQ